MRVTSKGQVTIPARIREEAGFLPNTEVEFISAGRGEVRLVKATKKLTRKSRGELLIEGLRGKGDVAMTTDEIMALTRGDR
jgi:AbrB family looped-hinge helix DNA binding protein